MCGLTARTRPCQASSTATTLRASELRPEAARGPGPLITAQYVDITVQRGPNGLRVLSQRHGRVRTGASVPRYAGPFEVVLYAGQRLRDRLRFGFPLTLANGPEALGVTAFDRRLAGAVEATTVVRLPYDPSLTHIVVRERGTRQSARCALRPAPDDPAARLLGPTRTVSFGSPAAATGESSKKARSTAKGPRSHGAPQSR